MRILEVDDLEPVASFRKQGLESDRYAVEVIYDGEQAQSLINEADFDLVILDSAPPKSGGFEALKRECRWPAVTTCADVIVSDMNMLDDNGIDSFEQLVQKGRQRPQFALMSGDFSDEDLARASRLGCAPIKTPLDMAQFAKWLEEVERLSPSKRTFYG